MAREDSEQRQKLTSTNRQEYKCSECSDTGFVLYDNLARSCICKKTRTIERYTPCDYRGAKLKTFIKRDVVVSVYDLWGVKHQNKTFPDDFDLNSSYFLTGKTRIGKTHLLWSQYRHFVESGKRCYAMSEEDLLKRLMELKHNFHPEHETAPFMLTNKVHFFLDDLGVEKVSEEKSGLLYSFFNELRENRCGLTVTCNYKPSVMVDERKLGQNTGQIIGRIKEMCQVVYFK